MKRRKPRRGESKHPKVKREVFANAKAKLARAREHLDAVRGEEQAYIARAIAIKRRQRGKFQDFIVQISERPPLRIAAIVGDAIHCARSALDHMAWELVVANGGEPTSDTCFLISDTEAKSAKNLAKATNGIAPKAVAAIVACEPFAGGNDTLHRLHRLDIADKHHLLLTVAAWHGGIRFETPTSKVPAILWQVQGQRFPLRHGDVVLSERIEPHDKRDPQKSLVVKLAFGDDFAKGEPIDVLLSAMIDEVEQVLRQLEGAIAR